MVFFKCLWLTQRKLGVENGGGGGPEGVGVGFERELEKVFGN